MLCWSEWGVERGTPHPSPPPSPPSHGAVCLAARSCELLLSLGAKVNASNNAGDRWVGEGEGG